jgi:hypothetical protein
MSFDSDINNYITSFNSSESFCDFLRTVVSDVNCKGVMYDNTFFFEKYSNTPYSVSFVSKIIINHILSNTEEFYNYVIKNDNKNFYIYYSNYILKVTPNLDMYKIITNGKVNNVVKHFNTFSRQFWTVENRFNFDATYTIDNLDKLKRNIINCLLNDNCNSLYIDGYCVFSTENNNIHHINNMIVRNYIIDNVDCLFEYSDTKINIHINDSDNIYRGHNISIVRNNDTFTIILYRESSGLVYDEMMDAYEKSNNMYDAMMSSFNYSYSKHNKTN